MTEKILINLSGNKKCGFEGIGGRPDDCKNNPDKYPDNWRPELCRKCPLDPKIPQAANFLLPSIYTEFKQTKKKN